MKALVTWFVVVFVIVIEFGFADVLFAANECVVRLNALVSDSKIIVKNRDPKSEVIAIKSVGVKVFRATLFVGKPTLTKVLNDGSFAIGTDSTLMRWVFRGNKFDLVGNLRFGKNFKKMDLSPNQKLVVGAFEYDRYFQSGNRGVGFFVTPISGGNIDSWYPNFKGGMDVISELQFQGDCEILVKLKSGEVYRHRIQEFGLLLTP